MAQLGDFVTARLVGRQECRQGVLIEIRSGVAIVEGMSDTYACEPDVVTVSDENIWLADVMIWVEQVRARLGFAA